MEIKSLTISSTRLFLKPFRFAALYFSWVRPALETKIMEITNE